MFNSATPNAANLTASSSNYVGLVQGLPTNGPVINSQGHFFHPYAIEQRANYSAFQQQLQNAYPYQIPASSSAFVENPIEYPGSNIGYYGGYPGSFYRQPVWSVHNGLWGHGATNMFNQGAAYPAPANVLPVDPQFYSVGGNYPGFNAGSYGVSGQNRVQGYGPYVTVSPGAPSAVEVGQGGSAAGCSYATLVSGGSQTGGSASSSRGSPSTIPSPWGPLSSGAPSPWGPLSSGAPSTSGPLPSAAPSPGEQRSDRPRSGRGSTHNRGRVPLTAYQTFVMLGAFNQSTTLTKNSTVELSFKTGLAPIKIQNWYQNRHAAIRRTRKSEEEKRRQQARFEESFPPYSAATYSTDAPARTGVYADSEFPLNIREVLEELNNLTN